MAPWAHPHLPLARFSLSQHRHAAGGLLKLAGVLDYLHQEVRLQLPGTTGPEFPFPKDSSGSRQEVALPRADGAGSGLFSSGLH